MQQFFFCFFVFNFRIFCVYVVCALLKLVSGGNGGRLVTSHQVLTLFVRIIFDRPMHFDHQLVDQTAQCAAQRTRNQRHPEVSIAGGEHRSAISQHGRSDSEQILKNSNLNLILKKKLQKKKKNLFDN